MLCNGLHNRYRGLDPRPVLWYTSYVGRELDCNLAQEARRGSRLTPTFNCRRRSVLPITDPEKRKASKMSCEGCRRSKDGIQFVSAIGPPSSPLTIVCAPTTFDLEEGQLGASGETVILANALSEARFQYEKVYIVPLVHQWPAAEDGSYTKLQLEQCAEEFKREISNSRSKVFLLLGREALAYFVSSGCYKGGLKRSRGYILTPSECLPEILSGAAPESLIATYSPTYVRESGFKAFAFFSKDILTAVRASRGEAPEIFGVPEQADELPSERHLRSINRLGIDIETNGYLGETEQIGYAWRSKL